MRRGFPSSGLRIFGAALLALVVVGPSRLSPQTAPVRWLEFDVEEDAARPLTGFIVGYFLPDERLPAISYAVDRAQTESPRPGVIRMRLIAGPLPVGPTFVVRLRSIAGGQPGRWSDPSAAFSVQSHEALPFVPSANEGYLRSAVAEFEGNPELKKRFTKHFPDVDTLRAASGYRTVIDVTAALFAARNLGVSFAEVKRFTAEADNRSLARAIQKLKPAVNARAEARRAVAQSREALGLSDPRRRRRL